LESEVLNEQQDSQSNLVDNISRDIFGSKDRKYIERRDWQTEARKKRKAHERDYLHQQTQPRRRLSTALLPRGEEMTRQHRWVRKILATLLARIGFISNFFDNQPSILWGVRL
jgi:hypothetical protein